MAAITFIKEILIGKNSLRLLMQDQTPLVEFENQYIHHIWILSQQITLLTDVAYLNEFSQISNFLWKGLQFLFIDQIAEYQNFYLTQVELEKKQPNDVFAYRLTDYKIFDISVMCEPHINAGHLHYFVYQAETGIPYRVVCPFPYTSLSTLVHYQILPIKS